MRDEALRGENISELARDGARARLSRRWLALAVVAGLMIILGIGWLADALANIPMRPSSPSARTQQAGLYMLALAINPQPLRAGVNESFTIRVTGISGDAVRNAQVTCDFTMPDMFMLPERVHAVPDGAGSYVCHHPLSATGAWSVKVTLQAPGNAPVHTTFPLQAD